MKIIQFSKKNEIPGNTIENNEKKWAEPKTIENNRKEGFWGHKMR